LLLENQYYILVSFTCCLLKEARRRHLQLSRQVDKQKALKAKSANATGKFEFEGKTSPAIKVHKISMFWCSFGAGTKDGTIPRITGKLTPRRPTA